MRLIGLLFLGSAVMAGAGRAGAQTRQTQVNGFGHVELTGNREAGATDAYFSLGEHSLFVASSLSSRISFLGEYVVRFNGASATNFLPSIERSLVKFSYSNQHAVIVGKVHTPANYWNDSYHHGRLFFPVIDRPLAFSHLVPLHMLGVQMQGQNLGRARFGYDVAVGNGVAASDASAKGTSPASLVALHVKPHENLRLGASYYYDHMSKNAYGAHSGHTVAPSRPATGSYAGPLTFQLASASAAWFSERVELLNEFSYNVSGTDSLGAARNVANFVYLGVRLGEHGVPYVFGDVIHVADNDLHVYPLEKRKIGVGYRYDFTPLVNLKAQVERRSEGAVHDDRMNSSSTDRHGHLTHAFGLRVQLAYGF